MTIVDTHLDVCPLCGHTALFLDDYENKEVIVICPDRFCPNYQGPYDR